MASFSNLMSLTSNSLVICHTKIFYSLCWSSFPPSRLVVVAFLAAEVNAGPLSDWLCPVVACCLVYEENLPGRLGGKKKISCASNLIYSKNVCHRFLPNSAALRKHTGFRTQKAVLGHGDSRTDSPWLGWSGLTLPQDQHLFLREGPGPFFCMQSKTKLWWNDS